VMHMKYWKILKLNPQQDRGVFGEFQSISSICSQETVKSNVQLRE
jgi:hypothetical protein